MTLVLAALLTVATSVVVYLLRTKGIFRKCNDAVFQIICGVLFGACAIFGTEFCSIEINGAAVNCRDAPTLCAGLLFGP